MQKIVNFANSVFDNYHIDSSILQNVQICVGKTMQVNGWVSLILSNREFIALHFHNRVFLNHGFVMNDEKVLKGAKRNQIYGDLDGDEYIIEEGIEELENGSRFEGLVLKEREGKMGTPFGYGEMYDDNGNLLYKGIMIDWKRFGYGTSYHDNGLKEYEGYWCDDNRFGSGKVYDRSGKLVKECEWYNGIESDTNEYCGDGSKPINIGMKHLKLTDKCVLDDWDVSWFHNLESIEIGDDCFGSELTFQIDGLNQLKTIKIGKNSFTQINKSDWGSGKNKSFVTSKSFYILNCESLESIEIGEYSFSDFAGDFELRNLPKLQKIEIGSIQNSSCNFYCSSLVIQGKKVYLDI